MPSASPELRDHMERLFGDAIDDAGPMNFLRDAGYVLTSGWDWEPKAGVFNFADMTHDEQCCLCFLADEWDMGGLIEREREQ